MHGLENVGRALEGYWRLVSMVAISRLLGSLAGLRGQDGMGMGMPRGILERRQRGAATVTGGGPRSEQDMDVTGLAFSLLFFLRVFSLLRTLETSCGRKMTRALRVSRGGDCIDGQRLDNG